MPLSNQGFNYILFATSKISNHVISVSIEKANVVTIAEALLKRVVINLVLLKLSLLRIWVNYRKFA